MSDYILAYLFFSAITSVISSFVFMVLFLEFERDFTSKDQYSIFLLSLFWPLTLVVAFAKLIRYMFKNIKFLNCTPEVIKKFLKWGFFE